MKGCLFLMVSMLACNRDPSFTPIPPPTCAVGDHCRTDRDCDDHIWCDGAELCQAVGHPNSNRCGCMYNTPPCRVALACSESMHECHEGCPTPDVDGDGHDSIACGGDDCDDTDAHRFPGHAEVCDAMNVDEDCDSSTFGTLDADADGFVSIACCNQSSDGKMTCGSDCNDADPGVHPGSPEVCNGKDDNCNGAIDETAQVALYVDSDGDGHGHGHGVGNAVMGCADLVGYSPLNNDCDDSNAALQPGSIKCQGGQQPANIFICSSLGVWQSATCAGMQNCFAQPNGTGICR